MRDHPSSSGSTHRGAWAFAAFGVTIVLLLFTEHRAHTLGALFWLLILACPLMHIFMHGGHGHGGLGRGDAAPRDRGSRDGVSAP